MLARFPLNNSSNVCSCEGRKRRVPLGNARFGERPTITRLNKTTLRPYVVVVLGISLSTAILFPFRAHLNALNLALLYLIVVTLVSLFTGTVPSIVASVLSFLCFDFFFIPPYYTFTVAQSDHVLTLFVFLGIAILVTQLIVRIRAQQLEVLQRAQQTSTLYSLSGALISEFSLDAMLMSIARRVRQVFHLESCAILLWQDDQLTTRAEDGVPIVERLSTNLLKLARWSLEKRQTAGIGTVRAKVVPPHSRDHGALWNFAQGFRGRDTLIVPIATTTRPIGVLIAGRGGRGTLNEDEQQLLETFANQAALAVERSLLADEHLRAELLARSDELKSALLSAVSHDLRTPLASIKASATSLLQSNVGWTEEDRRDLLEAIDEEADRLNQFVTNILDLTRIEAGALKPEWDWYDVREIVNSAIERCGAVAERHPFTVVLEDDLPLMFVDFIEIEQVLINLIENAAKYSPDAGGIWLTIHKQVDQIEMTVCDVGIGVPPGEEMRIFDKFYRVENPHRPIGSGVGLAICRGFIEAHQGEIWAVRNHDRGLTVHVTLPIVERGPVVAVGEQESTGNS